MTGLQEIRDDLERALWEMGEATEYGHLKRMVSDLRDGVFSYFILKLREVIRREKGDHWC